MVIDDIADRQHDCDILLDQNFYLDMDTRYNGKVPGNCKLLLCPRYALLRDEFTGYRGKIKSCSRDVKRILVFFGGIDFDNYTSHAIEALIKINISNLDIDVVIGSKHPFRERIIDQCAQHGFVCHVQTDKMVDLLATADLVIGAGGSVTWEHCFFGVPALAFSIATNQNHQIADAAQEGFLYSPDVNTDLVSVIIHHTENLINNYNLRKLISHRAKQAVDGRGVQRIIRAMGYTSIALRRTNSDDLIKLFKWRNHKNIRNVSRNTELISQDSHEMWFSSVLLSENKELLIGEKGEEIIGVVRFDIQKEDAEVSIYLVPDGSQVGQGQGGELLLSAEKWIIEKRLEIKNIFANVMGNNESSRRMFLSAGYHVDNTVFLKKLN